MIYSHSHILKPCSIIVHVAVLLFLFSFCTVVKLHWDNTLQWSFTKSVYGTENYPLQSLSPWQVERSTRVLVRCKDGGTIDIHLIHLNLTHSQIELDYVSTLHKPRYIQL